MNLHYFTTASNPVEALVLRLCRGWGQIVGNQTPVSYPNKKTEIKSTAMSSANVVNFASSFWYQTIDSYNPHSSKHCVYT